METKYEIKKDEEGLHAYLSDNDSSAWVFSILTTEKGFKLDWNDYLVPSLDDAFFIVDVTANFDEYMKSAPEDTFDPDAKFCDGEETILG